MEEKVMLNQGKLLFISGLFLLASCKTKEQKEKEKHERMAQKLEQANENYVPYKQFSEEIVGKVEYDKIYRSIHDSISTWKENKLSIVGFLRGNDWRIDSLVCINSSKDRIITVVLKGCFSCFDNNYMYENLLYLYGAKIKDEWYFFFGPTIYLPRRFYQSDESVPLSFEMLHKIAMNEIFGGYLTKTTQGNWEINDWFFTESIDETSCAVAFYEEDSKINYYVKYGLNKEEWGECMIRFTEAYWWTKSDLEDNPENDDPPI